MRVATQRGFSRPSSVPSFIGFPSHCPVLMIAASVSVVPGFDVHSSVRAVVRRDPAESCAVGVGHFSDSIAIVSSPGDFRASSDGRSPRPARARSAVGVGHMPCASAFTAVFRGSEFRSHCDGPPLFAASCVVGVGQCFTARSSVIGT